MRWIRPAWLKSYLLMLGVLALSWPVAGGELRATVDDRTLSRTSEGKPPREPAMMAPTGEPKVRRTTAMVPQKRESKSQRAMATVARTPQPDPQRTMATGARGANSKVQRATATVTRTSEAKPTPIAKSVRSPNSDDPVSQPVPNTRSSTIVEQEAIPSDAVVKPSKTSLGGCDGCGGCAGSCGLVFPTCQMCCIRTYGVWVDADFMLGWRHSIRTLPLVTTAPAGTPDIQAGVLGQATTTVVYPTEPIGEDGRPGARLGVGTWLDPWHCWGAEGRYFMLADERTQFSTSSTGEPILARPFFDVATSTQASRLLAFPGVVTPGNVSVTTESEVMGGDAILRRALCQWGCGRVDLLVGYQFARIDESLVIDDASTDADPTNLITDGTILAITDSFSTRNEYHAASVGAAAQFDQGCWRVDVLGKIGFGNMHEIVTIAGQTIVDEPPVGSPNTVTQTGLLAQGINIGTFTQDQFAVSPEVNVKLIYHVTPCIDVSAGYTFLYWSSLAQPGRQIDPDLRVPTDRFAIRDSEFWVHALTLGGQVKF